MVKIKPEHLSEATQRATLELADKGELVAAGFAGFIQAAYRDPRNVPYNQLQELQAAFYGAAQHTFAAICQITMSGTERLAEERMCKVREELDRFIIDFGRKHGLPAGPTATRIKQ